MNVHIAGEICGIRERTAMENDGTILCVSNSYERKYYLAPQFSKLPSAVREELQIMSVLYTEDIGGILTLLFDTDGRLYMQPSSEEGDLLYDEVGSILKIKRLREEKQELLSSLELYFRVMIRKEKIDLE